MPVMLLLQHLIEEIPLDRVEEPNNVAPVIVFLASSQTVNIVRNGVGVKSSTPFRTGHFSGIL